MKQKRTYTNKKWEVKNYEYNYDRKNQRIIINLKKI